MPFGYEGVYVIHGPPGCGKTTRVARTVRRILAHPDAGTRDGRCPVVVVSLTRTAAAEAAGRGLPLPDGAITTLHSTGYRSLYCPEVVDDEAIGEWNRLHPALAVDPALVRASDRRAPEDDPFEGEGGGRDGSPGDDAFREFELLRHRMVPREEWPPRVASFASKWESWKAETGRIDFTDMIARGGPHPLKPGVIIVDEAQDLSRLERAYLDRLRMHHGAALILVGDPLQAIYTWRGADPALLIDPALPPDRFDLLSQSYRVPARVIGLAQRWVGRLPGCTAAEYCPRRADPDDPDSAVVDGDVRRCGATWTAPDEAVLLAAQLAGQGKSVLILAATNRMTWPTCAMLRERGEPFDNPWRRKEGRWNPLRSGSAGAARALLFPEGDPWTIAEVAAWAAQLREGTTLRAGARGEIRKRRLECPLADVSAGEMGRWFAPGDPDTVLRLRRRGGAARPELVAWWVARVAPQRRASADYVSGVVLRHGTDALVRDPLIHPSTIHASKGGEADHVFLFPDLSRAAMEAWLDGGEGRDSIIRTFYVGMTRARECLHICEPAGRRYVEL